MFLLSVIIRTMRDASTTRKFYEPASRITLRPKFVEVCGGQLWYAPSHRESSDNAAAITSDLLPSFIALEHAEDEAIAEFARRQAALGLCAAHGLPLQHHSRGYQGGTFGDIFEYGSAAMAPPFCEEENPRTASDRTYYYENISDWRLWAKRFRIMSEEVEAARPTNAPQRRRMQRLHLAFMLGWQRDTTLPTYSTMSRQRAMRRLPDLLRIVNTWLDLAAVRAQLTLSREGKALPDLGGNEAFLFPALALQMLFYIVGGALPSIAHCAACGEPLTDRKRRPKAGQNAWCKKYECERVRKNLRPIRSHT